MTTQKTKKEKREKKEEHSPRTPHKEKAKGKREKPPKVAATRVRTREANQIPSWEQVVARAESTLNCRDRAWLKEWFEEQECSEWRDGGGNPIHNWGRALAVAWRYSKVDAARRDPERFAVRRGGDAKDSAPSAAQEARRNFLLDEVAKLREVENA